MNPGLPMPMYLPSQFAATGSHTSNPICESLVGAENPATRQNGTDTFSPAGVPNLPPVLGTWKSCGALIAVASVIVTCGISTEVKLSQDCCADADTGTSSNTHSAAKHKNTTER
jgi:hypothetical protein